MFGNRLAPNDKKNNDGDRVLETLFRDDKLIGLNLVRVFLWDEFKLH